MQNVLPLLLVKFLLSKIHSTNGINVNDLKVISSLLRFLHIYDFQAQGFQFCKQTKTKHEFRNLSKHLCQKL